MMLTRLLILIILGFSFIGIMGQPGEASLRDYLVNYGYWTTPQGAFEVEVYTDYDRDQSAFKQLQMKVEVEYGITDNLMTSLYGIFKQTPGQAATYDSSKIEMRYRLAEYDEWLVDPALYLEYVQPADASKNPKVEAKVILSKDVGDWNFVTNLKFYERELSPSAKTKFGYTVGTARAISEKAKLSWELKGSLGDEDSFGIMNSNKHYFIPGISFTALENTRINLGIGFGLTPSSDDFSFKTIVEYEFM